MSIRQWRAERHLRAQERVRAALAAHPEGSAFVLARCAGVGFGKLYVHLAEMEVSGEVTARWLEGPYPRRRLYRLVSGSSPALRRAEEDLDEAHAEIETLQRDVEEQTRAAFANQAEANRLRAALAAACPNLHCGHASLTHWEDDQRGQPGCHSTGCLCSYAPSDIDGHLAVAQEER